MLVQAIKQAKAEDLYGRLEPGQFLQLETLSSTLQQIANIPEKGRYTAGFLPFNRDFSVNLKSYIVI